MEQKINIKYEWWHVSYDYDNVAEEHKEVLKEHALERIFEMVREGFISGELNTYVNNEHYRGWWEIQ